MKNKPILSICIPTYNRNTFLIQCLDSIINKEGFNNIEIIISDNNSTDNTTKTVKKYLKKYKNIKYFKNKKNIGFVLNILKIIKLANGTYCWLLSDDDSLGNQKDILLNIKKLIIQYNFDQLILNTNEYDKQLKNIIKYNGLNIKKSTFFNNGNLFLEYITTKGYFSEFLAFMSVRIFKKSVWEKNKDIIHTIINNKNKFVFPHIMILTNNIGKQKILIEEKAYIKFRSNNTICITNNSIRKSIIYIYSLYVYMYKSSENIKFKNYIKGGIKKCINEFLLSFIIDLVKKIKIYEILCKKYKK